MYKTTLVEKSIEDGEKLVSKLEGKNFPIAAAFWRYLEEPERYRLVIVSPLVHEEGPLGAYGHINEVVSELGDSVRFDFNDISVMSPSWSEFRGVRWMIEGSRPESQDERTAPATHQWFGYDDLYLYRWNPGLM